MSMHDVPCYKVIVAIVHINQFRDISNFICQKSVFVCSFGLFVCLFVWWGSCDPLKNVHIVGDQVFFVIEPH